VIDLVESEKGFTLTAHLPGVKPEELKIDVHENVLTASAPAPKLEGEKERDLVREARPRAFQRRFTLADTIDQSKIEASLVDGVLKLALPKVEKAQPRQIKIKVS
jgi:HSP20 family molecular chaperone IbpA